MKEIRKIEIRHLLIEDYIELLDSMVVDLDLLKELHNFGSVRNLKDRRTDIYRLEKTRK